MGLCVGLGLADAVSFGAGMAAVMAFCALIAIAIAILVVLYPSTIAVPSKHEFELQVPATFLEVYDVACSELYAMPPRSPLCHSTHGLHYMCHGSPFSLSASLLVCSQVTAAAMVSR